MAPHATGLYPNGHADTAAIGTTPVHPTAARRGIPVIVNSPTSQFTDTDITSKFEYRGAHVVVDADKIQVTPTVQNFEFKTTRNVQKTG